MRSSLIADDEKLIREGLARSIPWEALGYDKVFTASNAYEAIATLSTETITLLITDIQMPGKTGIELLEWVKTNSPETKTIIISGYDKFEYARTAIRLGVEDYILKPIKKKELTDKIASINKKLESLNSQRHYERVFYLRKLLENTYLSHEELEEIKMRLEVPGADSNQFYVLLIDKYSNESYNPSELLSGYFYDTIGIYLVALLPASDEESFTARFSSLTLPYALGSKQDFDSLCISYRKAKESLLKGEERVYSFNASLSEHRDLMKLLSYLSDGQYQAVDDFLADLFPKFGNVQTAKRWCLWFMDNLEQYFEKYKFTGIYQNAVKTCQSEDIKALSEIFSAYIKKVYMTFEEKTKSSSSLLIDQAERIIVENLSNKNFSLTLLSEELQVSYGYLSNLFKQETGKNFCEYLTEARLGKAKDLLSDRTLRLYEIADQCGYSNYRYFSECFKKRWGKSPSEYHAN